MTRESGDQHPSRGRSSTLPLEAQPLSLVLSWRLCAGPCLPHRLRGLGGRTMGEAPQDLPVFHPETHDSGVSTLRGPVGSIGSHLPHAEPGAPPTRRCGLVPSPHGLACPCPGPQRGPAHRGTTASPPPCPTWTVTTRRADTEWGHRLPPDLPPVAP